MNNVSARSPSQQTIPLNRTTGTQSDHFIQSTPPQEVGSERLLNSGVSWRSIKEKALENENLTSDIRVGDNSIRVKRGIWEKIKIFCGYRTVASRDETLQNLKDHLMASFHTHLMYAIDEMGIGEKHAIRENFITEAQKKLDEITTQLETSFKDTRLSSSQVIQQTNKAAVSSLFLLRQKNSTPDLTPQFIKTSAGDWCVIRPAPHPENMVLSGGGVKGVGYIGAYQAMEKTEMLKHLRCIAGSSAGAMTAALIASGMNSEALQQASDRVSFFNILIGKSKNSNIQQSMQFAKSGYFEGSYAVETINKEMVGSVTEFLQSADAVNFEKRVSQLVEAGHLSEGEKKVLLQLKKDLLPVNQKHFPLTLFSKKNQSFTHLLTFEELALLQKVDPQAPSRFKELTITGFDETQKKEIYYNAKDHPKMSIASAVRVSMSLPSIFRAIKSASGDIMEDGGVGSNLATEVYGNENRAKTLVLGFDQDGHFYDIANRGGTKIKKATLETSLETNLEEWITQNPNLEANAAQDRKKLYEAGPNALDVYHGNL